MDPSKDTQVTIVDTAREQELTQSKPTSAETRIHWVSPQSENKDLEAQFEAMRARNWITDRMVQQYQKHWHCSRPEALQRLLAKSGL